MKNGRARTGQKPYGCIARALSLVVHNVLITTQFRVLGALRALVIILDGKDGFEAYSDDFTYHHNYNYQTPITTFQIASNFEDAHSQP